jgi:hypothetical protein
MPKLEIPPKSLFKGQFRKNLHILLLHNNLWEFSSVSQDPCIHFIGGAALICLQIGNAVPDFHLDFSTYSKLIFYEVMNQGAILKIRENCKPTIHFSLDYAKDL